jgi:hypothetical protein
MYNSTKSAPINCDERGTWCCHGEGHPHRLFHNLHENREHEGESMTTNQPLSLFISCKMAELAEERRAVQSALSCAGYLAYLFSKRLCRRNEQHEPHAGSFPVRRQIHLQICGEMLSSQAHVSIQSAMLKRVSHLPGFSALTFDAGEEEECFSELVPLQPEGLGACETGFPTAQARGSKLVTEDSKPVGSGETIHIT